MSTPKARDRGVLVVHADGAVSWWSNLEPAVAAVTVPVGHKVAVQVDAAQPDQVLAWSAHSGGDLAALAHAFDDPDLVDRIAVLAAEGDDVFLDGAPTLTEAWVRQATVVAVQQCTVRPVSEGVLSLSRAEAEYATGNRDFAVRLFAISAPVLLSLGEQCLGGTVSAIVAADIARIAEVAAQALRSNGWGPDVAALSQRLNSELGAAADRAIADLLKDWVPAVKSAPDLGEGDTPAALRSTFIDPQVVPQRLLAWPGADSQDLVIEIGEDNSALVSASLADSVDVRSPEAEQLMAYAATGDGRLVAVAPMHVVGRSVSAKLIQDDVDPRILQFGIYHSGTDPTRLRTDAVGQALIEADRWMLDAYNRHRFAQAVVYASPESNVDDAEKLQKLHLGIARTAADNAIDVLETVGLTEGLDSAVAAQLLARRKAIGVYRDTLTPDAATTHTWQPLLAEVVEPDPLDDDLDD